MAFWSRKKNDDEAGPQDQRALSFLSWLADAPLFIDRKQVGAFYDAVVYPEHRTGKIQLSSAEMEGLAKETKIGVDAKIGLAEVFPFLKTELGASAAYTKSKSKSRTEERSIELFPIDTAERKLVHLALHYFNNLSERLFFVEAPLKDTDWCASEIIAQLPRGMVFLDFPKGVKLMPVAVEGEKGRVVAVFDALGKALGVADPSQPNTQGWTEKKKDGAWIDYWGRFSKAFSSVKANRCLEKAIEDSEVGRIRWIDYRIPLADRTQPLHLHVSAAGEYDTGVFAYNMIQRGYSHGLRIVGTLRAAPGVTTLAVFEK